VIAPRPLVCGGTRADTPAPELWLARLSYAFVHTIGPLTAEFVALLQHPMTEVPGLVRFSAQGR
jgi:hypothetical protein